MTKNKISDVRTQFTEVFGRNGSRKMIVKFVLCALLLRSVSGELMLPLNESGDSVTRVIERIFGINETVCIITDGIMIDVEFNIPNPKIIWNLNATQKLGNQQTVYNFIIQVNDSNSLGNVLKHLEESSAWHAESTPSGTFLIIISEIDKVFENLWKYNISNSVILVNGNGSSKCKLYQSTQWSVENECGTKPNVIYEEDCHDGPTLTFKKGFRSYHGCPITFNHKYNRSNFTNATMKELTERYGVNLVLVIAIRGHVQYDILYYNFGRLKMRRFTYAVEFRRFVWLMPLPKQIPPLKVYLIIFQEEVWIMVAVGFLLTISFYVIISLCKRIPVNLSTFGFIIMEVLSLTFWGCCSRIPNVTLLRVLLLSYIFYAIVVQTGYVSNLIRVQTIPQFEPGIDSIRELVQSNIPIFSHFMFFDRTNGDHPIFENTEKEIQTTSFKELDRIVNSIIVDNNQTGVIIVPGDQTISMFSKHKIIHNKLIFDDSVLKTQKWGLHTPKEFYFFDFLNKVVTALAENGFYAHLREKENRLFKNAIEFRNYPTDPQVLNLDHVHGIFVIWGFGLGISFLVFILEIILHKLQVYKSNTIKPIAVTEKEDEEEEEEVEIIDIEYTA
ncbi:hypothetical protein RI129_004270 [Pyrocoelia pectoralis]|uniref:Ionotropic glutamate receptor C-terminal domain-containing protein n=1 Tax=Pyrocoelia pectoralis TaxID=417401 RepID=A0AAN7VHZ1_9COLE